MRSTERNSARSECPIATTLAMVGDRWSLVIIRDMLVGKTRFAEFLDSPERISTNILTDRLGRLEEHGLIAKSTYQTNPVRFEYRLTDKGQGLHAVLQEICRWGNEHEPNTFVPPKAFMRRIRRKPRGN